MKKPNYPIRASALYIIVSTALISISAMFLAIAAQTHSPAHRSTRVSERPNPPSVQVSPQITQSEVGGMSLTWATCGSCPEIAEVNVVGNTVSMGVPNRPDTGSQNIAIHGASAALPASSKYTITFQYDWSTWDSYSPPSEGYNGFWDSFSVSVASLPYWQLPISNPITENNLPGLALIWGGQTYGNGAFYHTTGTKTITVNGDSSGTNYLNVVLDTVTPPSDHAYPSWGSVTITSISTDCADIASQAANLATTVVPGTYSYGGKGYTCAPFRLVEAQEIGASYNQYHALNCTNYGPPFSCEPAPGLDCAGLVFWSYNKAVGATTHSNGFVQLEDSFSQCGDALSDLLGLSPTDLRSGDIACFKSPPAPASHVAIYIGGNDAVEAANCTAGIHHTTKSNLENRVGFAGWRRLKCSSQYGLIVQSHSPISLVVTDPDGYTVSVDTVLYTQEEVVHGIPGVLSYVQDDIDGDVVVAPTLKSGVYAIRVVPKKGVSPDATYGLEVTGAGYLLDLGQNVPISNIPPDGYRVRSTGEEITPVNPTLIPTTTTINSDTNPAQVGQAVTFTATVSSDNGIPSGNVAFREAGNVLGTVALTNGVAILTTDSLAVGVHPIVAEYLGDGSSFSGSVSSAINEEILPTSSCIVCHKHTTTLTLPCNSMEYRRHLDHGDTLGPCKSKSP